MAETDNPVPSFKAIYLDTNVLIESQWPNVSIPLHNLLAGARHFEIPVFLPEPVEREAEGHWMRKVQTARSRLENARREYDRQTGNLQSRAELTYDRTLESLRADYKQAAKARKDEYGVRTVPITSRSLESVFDAATRYILPFEIGSDSKSGEGRGFQDAVILASVLEHLTAQKVTAVVVSGDAVFSQVRVPEFMPECSTASFSVQTLAVVSKVLFDGYWTKEVRIPWQQEAANAKVAVETSEAVLKEFLFANLNSEMLSRSGQKVLELQSVEKVSVYGALTPIPPEGKKDRFVKFAVSVNVDCIANVEQGDFADLVELWTGKASRTTVVVKLISWLGGVEATADVRDGEYKNLRFTALLTVDQLGATDYMNPQEPETK